MPEDIQKALDENVFGEPASRMAGQVWDDIDVKGRSATDSAEGNAINEASADDVTAYQPIADKIIDSVMAEVDEKGIDAAAAKAMIESEMSGK